MAPNYTTGSSHGNEGCIMLEKWADMPTAANVLFITMYLCK
jgi:hypothetical protein